MPLYETARNKVAWANHHISDIQSRTDDLKKCLAVTAHVNSDTGCEFIKCDFAEGIQGTVIDELALRLGDAIHNLKCALDHAWFQTVTRLLPAGDWDKERVKFPVYPNPDLLKRALQKLKIDVSVPTFCDFLIGDIKPYDGGDFAIWTVHKLNARDKHRLLIPVLHYSSIGDIYLKNEDGAIERGYTWATEKPLPHYVPFRRGVHIENPGSASFSIMFEYGKAGNHTRMVDTLRIYSEHILATVKLLEEFRE